MSLAPESWPFVLVLAGTTVLVALAAGPAWAVLPFALLAFVAWFFRDPERTVPDDPRALVSPADGRIILAGPERISIFMNVFDVHVCRAPAGGRVERVQHVPGRFLAAFKDEASEHNERTTITLGGNAGSLCFTLVAGLIARRIVCRVAAGQALRAGDRVGLIRFGSRVDVDLPPGGRPAVAVGDRVRAGETVIARLDPFPI